MPSPSYDSLNFKSGESQCDKPGETGGDTPEYADSISFIFALLLGDGLAALDF